MSLIVLFIKQKHVGNNNLKQNNPGENIMKTFKKTSLITLLGTTAALSAMSVSANEDPVKLGLMLPYSGTYTALGEAITNGLNLIQRLTLPRHLRT